MHYTIGYDDFQRKHHEICEYAENTYDAMKHAKEDVPFLKELVNITSIFSKKVIGVGMSMLYKQVGK